VFARVFGRYRLDRLIREGDSTEVYEASVLGAGGFVRKVAVKRLKPALAREPTATRAFEAEARLVSRVHHANVVGVLDFGTTDGQPYQVLEHVDGVDLLRLESRTRAARVTASPTLWAAVVTEAAHGLDHVHNLRDENGRPLGIVHRDVTPSNVLIAWSGDVKLADFGRALSHGPRDVTQAGQVKGELEFIAPEQQRGELADARADVFALGCLLHRMLTGASPQASELARKKIVLGEPPPIDPPIPEDLARLITHAIAPDVSKRMATAAMFAEGCTRWLATQGIVDGRSVVRDAMTGLARALDAASAPHGMIAALVNVGALLDGGESSQHDTQIPSEPRVPIEPNRVDFGDETELVSPKIAAFAAEVAPTDQGFNDTTDKSDDQTRDEPGPPAAMTASVVTSSVARDAIVASVSASSEGGDRPSGEKVTMHVGPPPEEITGDEVLRPPIGYQILEPIAQGGFAQVFRALHEDSAEIVALKILLHERRHNTISAARFDREVGALAEIESAYLVKLRDSGRLDDGRPWMAMELLEGRTLAHEIVAADGPMPPARIRGLARDLALGLAALHAADLVHRDLGARNVMVVESGGVEKAMIIDLGHARWTDERPRSKLTMPGLVLGNARWMAPEQIHAPSKVGPAADLYSLGLLILAMTTGRAPFSGSPASILEKQLEEVPEIPPGPFSALIRRLIEKDPARRWSNAAALASELNQIRLPRTGTDNDTAIADVVDRTMPLGLKAHVPIVIEPPARRRVDPLFIGASIVVVLAVVLLLMLH